MSRLNQWFVLGDGIAREIITADLHRYLGPDALVRPGPGTGEYEGRPGYWITAYRTLTRQMIEDLKLDTQRWQQEKDRYQRRYGGGGNPYARDTKVSRHPNAELVAYQDSNTHASRQHYGPSEGMAPLQTSSSYEESAAYSHTPSQPYSTPPVNAQYATYGSPYSYQSTSTQQDPYNSTYGRPYSYQSTSTQQDPYSRYRPQYAPQAAPGYYVASDGRQYPLSQQPPQPPDPTRRSRRQETSDKPLDTKQGDTDASKPNDNDGIEDLGREISVATERTSDSTAQDKTSDTLGHKVEPPDKYHSSAAGYGSERSHISGEDYLRSKSEELGQNNSLRLGIEIQEEASSGQGDLPMEKSVPFDSGYGSNSDAITKAVEADVDASSIRSILNNATRVSLPAEEKKAVIEAFCGDLCQDIGFYKYENEERERLLAQLPDLLKSFAIRLGGSVSSKAERNAKEFIRQQRENITHQLHVLMTPEDSAEYEKPPSESSNGMSVADKMRYWDTEGALDEIPMEPDLEVEQPDDAEIPPIYEEVRSYLFEDTAYKWLLDNARSSAVLTERRDTFLETISKEISCVLTSQKGSSRNSQIFQSRIRLDWDLIGFLEDQNYGTSLETALEHAITLTGTDSDAQALSCIDYMCQTWPSSGREIIRALQSTLTAPKMCRSWHLLDGTALEMFIHAQSSEVIVQTLGNQSSIIELCEGLSWLTAALRGPPSLFPDGIWYSIPWIEAHSDSHTNGSLRSINVSLGSKVTRSSSSRKQLPDAVGTCWHAMFENPLLASGFPILARPKREMGLEVPFDMMSVLAETPISAHYDRYLILKGFSTMLVPTQRTEDSVVWHFLVEREKRVPFYAFRDQCGYLISTDKFDIYDLQNSEFRNFVGWVSTITKHLGTEDTDYAGIDWAGAKKCSAGLAMEEKLTISLSKIVGVSGNFVRGNRDKPEYVKQSVYSAQMDAAKSIPVVIYDVASHRGWLVDGASALLHTVRAQVIQEPYKDAFNTATFIHPPTDGGFIAAAETLKNEQNMKHVVCREFDSYVEETATSSQLLALSGNETTAGDSNSFSAAEGRKVKYKTICFKDLVTQTWSTFEQIYDRQVDVKTSHATKELRSPFKVTLEGYEFMDLVTSQRTLKRKYITLKSNGRAWKDLANRINAITLFGENFGDLFKPSSDSAEAVCKDWSAVPPGHEFLAAPISLLQQIKQQSWRGGEVDRNTPEIAEDNFWIPSNDAFSACSLNCKHDLPSRVQRISTSLSRDEKTHLRNESWEAQAFKNMNGAVLFGESSTLDLDSLSLPSLQGSTRTGNMFADSGLGSSLQDSMQASSGDATFAGASSSDSQHLRASIRTPDINSVGASSALSSDRNVSDQETERSSTRSERDPGSLQDAIAGAEDDQTSERTIHAHAQTAEASHEPTPIAPGNNQDPDSEALTIIKPLGKQKSSSRTPWKKIVARVFLRRSGKGT